MKGYKAFDKYLCCLGMHYEISKEYIFNGNIELCKSGYHFCKSIADCYRYYPTNEDTRICEIEALGNIKTSESETKFCTNHIKIIREIENPCKLTNIDEESKGYCNVGSFNNGDWNSGSFNNGSHNSGNYNEGDGNTGDHNKGSYNAGCNNERDCNTGNYNEGDGNTGDRNKGSYNAGCNNEGDHNTGYDNSGHSNTGEYNKGSYNAGCNNEGDHNTGDDNIGNYNSGDYNKGDHNAGFYNYGNYHSGIFNVSQNPKIYTFDQPSDWTMEDWIKSYAYTLLSDLPFASDKQKWWNDLKYITKKTVFEIPNFDPDKFRICTGIDVTKDYDEYCSRKDNE